MCYEINQRIFRNKTVEEGMKTFNLLGHSSGELVINLNGHQSSMKVKYRLNTPIIN